MMYRPSTTWVSTGHTSAADWRNRWSAFAHLAGTPVVLEPSTRTETARVTDADIIGVLPPAIIAAVSDIVCPYHHETGCPDCIISDAMDGEENGISGLAAMVEAACASLATPVLVSVLTVVNADDYPESIRTKAEAAAARRAYANGPISIGGSGYSKVD